MAGLDRPYQLDIEFKPYSCARPIHNAIDCALDIRRKHSPDLNRVRSIEMRAIPSGPTTTRTSARGRTTRRR